MAANTKILIIGDLHFRPKEIDLNRLLVTEVLEIIKEIKPDGVVVLGDTLDTHDVYKGSAHSLSERFFHRIRLLTKLVVLLGNHDLKNNQVNLTIDREADHPYTALKYWDNTILVDDVTLFDINGHQFCAVPYLPNGCFMDAIKDVDQRKITSFFSHQLFDFPGNYEPEADKWPDDCKMNFCGHIHEYMMVKHNLCLVGTPTTTDFGASPDKALMLVTFNEEGDFEIERIPLKTVPLRVAYRIEGSIQNIKNIINEIKSRTTPGIYKVTIYGKSQLLANLKKNTYYKELKSMVNKIIEESVGTDLVMCKGVTDEVIMNGDFEEILLELLEGCPKELAMYRQMFPSNASTA